MDDPDHIAIKARAKEMQRQEMEEIRQREANETALQAIGSHKKRLKTNSSGVFNSSAGSNIFGSFTSKPVRAFSFQSFNSTFFPSLSDQTYQACHDERCLHSNGKREGHRTLSSAVQNIRKIVEYTRGKKP